MPPSRAFLKFCQREEYIEGDPLSGFQVPKAAQAYVKCPSDEEIRVLLRSRQERWKPSVNPGARFVHASARLFFSRRNYAIIAGLIETGARIGELLSLALDDYQPGQAQIVIGRMKSDEPRTVPISTVWMEVVDAYLRVRPRVETNLLFVSEYGERIEVSPFGKQFQGYLEYAGPSGFTLHSLRHYAITQMAKTDVWAASIIAGHKDLQVTRRYLHEDPSHVRAVHSVCCCIRLCVFALSPYSVPFCELCLRGEFTFLSCCCIRLRRLRRIGTLALGSLVRRRRPKV